MTAPADQTRPGVRVGAVVRQAEHALAAAGVADPAVDAQLIVGHVLGVSRGGVQAAALRGDGVAEASLHEIEALLERRARREPLQHLTGRAPFRHLDLQVGPGVFVPRPETEVVAQLAVDALNACPTPSPRAVDLGTGSGAIALALATEVPRAQVWAIERSPQAHAWAQRNLDEVGVTNVHLEQADFTAGIEVPAGTMDVVVSNPPYVPEDALPQEIEVREHDPAQALYSGADGLDDIRVIARVGLRLVRRGGAIILEHGQEQGEAVRAILAEAGWRLPATHPDLTMRERATSAVAP